MRGRALLQFCIVALIWGTTWIVIKMQLGQVNPSWSVAYRFLTGGLALLAWCWIRGLPLSVPWRVLPFVGLVGLFQFTVNFNLIYRASEHVTSGIPAVAFALLMIPNALLAALFLKRRVPVRFLVGSALGIIGVALLFWREFDMPGDHASTALGLMMVIGGVLAASSANVMQGSRMALTYPPLTGLAWAMLLASAMNAVIGFTLSGPPSWDPRPEYWLGVLYLGVLASAVAFALYFNLIAKMGPAEAAWTGVPIPIVAMMISTIFEGYRWTWVSAAGATIALCGLVVALWQPKFRVR